MASYVTTGRLGQPDGARGLFDRSLEHRFVQMMSPALTCPCTANAERTRCELVLAHVQGMALPVEQDQPLDLADIRFLRSPTVVSYPHGFSALIEELGPVPWGSVRDADRMME